MPTYNQTFERWELIVVADGCTDDTAAVVRGVGDRRVRLVVEDEHCGSPGQMRNRGVGVATGSVVCYLDHDDQWVPEHLAMLATLYKDAANRVVATGCRRVNRDGRMLGATVPLNLAWHPELQVVSPIFEPSRVSHRRDVLDALGGWVTDQVGLEDWDLWVRMADAGETFTVLSARTVSCTLDSRSRRHRLGHRYLHGFGPPLEAADAARILARTQQDDVRNDLNRHHRADVAAWYRALRETGELRLTDSMTIDSLLGALEADEPDRHFSPHVRRCGDRYVLCRILACRSRAHAERIVAINRRRMPRSTSYLADLMRAEGVCLSQGQGGSDDRKN